MNWNRIVALFLCAGLFGATPAASQTLWDGPPAFTASSDVSLTWLKPNFGTGPEVDAGFLTSKYVLEGRAAIGDRAVLHARFPFAHARLESNFGDDEISGTVAGNPYLGTEIYSTSGSVFLEAGLRLPLTPDESSSGVSSAQFIGTRIDVDHVTAFLTESVPVQVVGNYVYAPATSDFSLRLRFGSETVVSTNETTDSELFTVYAAQGWYEADRLDVGFGLTGRWLATEDGSFGGNSFHQLGLTAIATLERVRPGVLLRVPIDDDLSTSYNYVFGLSLSVPLD